MPPFVPSIPCSTPGCNVTVPRHQKSRRCGACRERELSRQSSPESRGYAPGWADDFVHEHPVCFHQTERCTTRATLADHFPRSRKELLQSGVPNDMANEWEYLVPSCAPCHRLMTARRQPGGWARPGWEQ